MDELMIIGEFRLVCCSDGDLVIVGIVVIDFGV